MHTSEENFYKAVAIVATILGIVIIYFIISIVRYQRRNARLYKMMIRAEINTLEKERKRIATDIHDELGPILSAVRLQINHLETPTSADAEIVMKTNKYIDDLLTKTREISYNLLPNTLVRKGLTAAINEFVNKHHLNSSLKISFDSDTEIQLTKEQEINIYRIIQEIVNNTVKHAGATLLNIALYKNKDKIVLETSDNGKGFDYNNKLTAGNGLGLYNLQSRADVLHARFNLVSDFKTGTYYSFEIPKAAV